RTRRLTPASLDRRRASSRPGAAIRQSHTHLGACKPRRSNDRLLMRLLRISRAPTDQLDRNRDKGSAMRFAKFLLLTCSAMAPVSALAEEDVADVDRIVVTGDVLVSGAATKTDTPAIEVPQRSTAAARPRPSEAVTHGAVDVALGAHEAVAAREAGRII